MGIQARIASYIAVFLLGGATALGVSAFVSQGTERPAIVAQHQETLGLSRDENRAVRDSIRSAKVATEGARVTAREVADGTNGDLRIADDIGELVGGAGSDVRAASERVDLALQILGEAGE